MRWGECDVRQDPLGRLVLRHDPFDLRPWTRSEQLLCLDALLEVVAERPERALRFDLKEGGEVAGRVQEALRRSAMVEDRVWFNARVDTLGERGFRRLRAEWPGAVVQRPVDFAAPLLLGAPGEARRLLDGLRSWGVDRFSLSWAMPQARRLMGRLGSWDHDVNVYGVHDLESFLQAVLLLPRSVTADFDFPEWGLEGSGSGAAALSPGWSVDLAS